MTTADCLIRTHTGKLVDPFDLDPSLICIEDVAFALASISRFGGHTRLTVAQHSCMVCDQLRSCADTAAFAFDGLMHDASESMGLLDLPAPVKYRPEMQAYRIAEHRAGSVLAEVFGFRWPKPPEVAVVDKRMRYTEQRDLMGREHRQGDEYEPYPVRVRVWSRHLAEYAFLKRFLELNPKREIR